MQQSFDYCTCIESLISHECVDLTQTYATFLAFRHSRLCPTWMGTLPSLLRTHGHRLEPRHPALRHGVRRHSFRNGRTDLQRQHHLSHSRLRRLPRFDPELSENQSVVAHPIGKDPQSSVDDLQRHSSAGIATLVVVGLWSSNAEVNGTCQGLALGRFQRSGPTYLSLGRHPSISAATSNIAAFHQHRDSNNLAHDIDATSQPSFARFWWLGRRFSQLLLRFSGLLYLLHGALNTLTDAIVVVWCAVIYWHWREIAHADQTVSKRHYHLYPDT